MLFRSKAISLRIRWLWQTWTQEDKAWIGLPLGIDDKAKSLFHAATDFRLGNGQRFIFWHDPWMAGQRLATVAPDLYKQCTLRNLTVQQALTDGKWTRHFKQNLTQAAIMQFINIHDSLSEINLVQDHPDKVSWRWTPNGVYSATSVYQMQFEGSLRFNFREIIWNSEAPLKCRIYGWLAILGKCNTADCLMKKGWPHNAACVMCLAEPETALHLLAACPIATRLWRKILSTAQLPANLAPRQDTASLEGWLTNTMQQHQPSLRKNWTTLVHLTWWCLWKERNARIFENKASALSRIHANVIEEARNWSLAGKSRALSLLQRPREPD